MPSWKSRSLGDRRPWHLEASPRRAPAEFAEEMRLAAAIHWYSQGTISQGKAAEIAGVSRAEFLEELFHRKIPAIQVTLDELRQELAGE